MGIPALPAPELLISIANMAWLADEVVALFPEDQLLRKTGEGFTSFTFAGEIPLAADTVLKPVLYNDTAHGRVLIASHPDFLARCLADGGGVAKHPDFRSANEGIPASGNAFVYLSSDLSSVLKDLNQTQISQMQAQAKTPTAAPAIMPLLAAFSEPSRWTEQRFCNPGIERWHLLAFQQRPVPQIDRGSRRRVDRCSTGRGKRPLFHEYSETRPNT